LSALKAFEGGAPTNANILVCEVLNCLSSRYSRVHPANTLFQVTKWPMDGGGFFREDEVKGALHSLYKLTPFSLKLRLYLAFHIYLSYLFEGVERQGCRSQGLNLAWR
jgi:hypothetical protein